MINQELLEKFKRLYQEKFNVNLTDEEATQMATDFLNLMKILVSPDPRSQEKIHNTQIRQGYETKQI